MANVFPGYRGTASIEGIGAVRFSDANIAATQEINAPDIVMGDWDHDAYNYGPITVGGTINGPVTETFVAGTVGGGLWDWGVKRTGDCGLLSQKQIDLYYYCGTPDCGVDSSKSHRLFEGMTVNSVNFSVTAGDVANFSIDVLGRSAGLWDNDEPTHFTAAEKLLTWDKVNVTIDSKAAHEEDLNIACINYQAFDFTISNNLETVYSLAQTNLFPYEIVPGLRTITGTLTAYNIPQALGSDTYGGYEADSFTTITFGIGTLSITMFVQFHRIQPASSVGMITSTLGFTGVTHQTGPEWIQT